ncbi:reverse transcriptase domain-containing protein [Pseudomonas sp. Pseu.R1]|uniref:reverse transcriptase domain-containing protein n=1 Tax=Pseudomonas sp. Pseu.R1 TaxID=3379818 RepID=UPI003B9360F4
MDASQPFGKTPEISISSNKELAALLGVSVAKLTYYAYRLDDDSKYRSFHIAKRSEGQRLIEAPVKGLKELQKSIIRLFEPKYKPRSCVYAYVKGRGIVEHAAVHANQRWLLRFDLKEFFHSISAARVAGLLRRPPFSYAKPVADTIARLCTKDGRLTQGAPTSPLISNILCKGLDFRLKELASQNKCYYTRYADDVFISNNGSLFPSSIAERDANGTVKLSDEIVGIVIAAGFQLNFKKTTLRSRAERQLATGIIVNRKLNVPKEYVKSVRAALYAWEKYDLKLAEEYWRVHVDKRNRHGEAAPRLSWVVRGKINHIGHVKGYNDPVFLTLAKRLQALDPTYRLDERKILRSLTDEIHVYTEGITDCKHLEAALNFFKSCGEFTNLNLIFRNTRKPGSSVLKALCENLSEAPQKHLTICVFDRDERSIIAEMGGSPGNYRDHTNNVFSLIIPIPEFRDSDFICIEHLYQDAQLYMSDTQGRRLYSKDEFDQLGCFKGEQRLFCRLSKQSLIYDDNVIDLAERKNVALPKNKFADYILNKVPPFSNIDFSGFRGVFFQIVEIAGFYGRQRDG